MRSPARPARNGLRALYRRFIPPAPALPLDRPGEVGDDVEPGAVDVVVPVHGAHEELRALLVSLRRHTDLRRHRLLLVVDGDPGFDPAWAEDDAEMLVNETCRGFVASVNRGMAESDRDVVLLNSDTLVTAGWLGKMQRAAYSCPAVATVTPFSNHATICSLPRPLVANELPRGYDADRFAALVERVARPEYPRLPTGVGMCLYVKRRVIETVGPFDEEAFGSGYGEETDFCLRALKAGYVHVLDDATFVFHHGERSFGAARAARVRAAEKALGRRHPEFVPTLAAFLAEDPLREARRRVRWALRPARPARPPRRVLHVVHGWPPHNHAGTELYARWLAEEQAAHREVAVYARVADPGRRFGDAEESDEGGIRLRLVVNNFTQREPASRNALRSPRLERDFGRFADDFRPELVHVHHLAGHALGLLAEVARRRLPLLYQVQDWWALCARANLRRPGDGDGEICPGPSPRRCSACLPMTALPGAALLNPLLYRYRRRLVERGLAIADAYVMGSRAIEADYRAAGLLLPGDRVYVLPYGVRLPDPAPEREDTPAAPLRFGYVGSIQPHKGLHVAAAAFRGLTRERAVFRVWGDPAVDPAYAERLRELAPPGVLELQGRFGEGEKSGVFAEMDVLLLPSLGLESFGLVAREALAHGVPVIASRRGALEELFAEDGAGGTWVEPGDDGALGSLLGELVARPEKVSTWRRRIRPVTGTSEHAAAIEHVYADVLGGGEEP